MLMNNITTYAALDIAYQYTWWRLFQKRDLVGISIFDSARTW